MILGIKGEKNSGKTTLIENILKKFNGKVVVIKSSSTDYFDDPGKDTWRYRKAGALASIIIGREETAMFSSFDTNTAIEIAKKFHPDLIVFEGYKKVKGDLIIDMNDTINEDEILKRIKKGRKKIEIFVDGRKLPLNPFIANLLYKTIKAMLSTLKKGEGEEVDILING